MRVPPGWRKREAEVHLDSACSLGCDETRCNFPSCCVDVDDDRGVVEDARTLGVLVAPEEEEEGSVKAAVLG